MQTKQPCVCGRAYWPNQAWQHEGCATNRSATNRVATNSNVTNTQDRALDVPEAETEAGLAASVPVRTLNRRSRESYNAYQREYMRKRRA
jgi:hypothetical protein